MIKSPLKAIRAKCLECSCDSMKEVRECPITDCDLHNFRFGKNPFRKKRTYTPEQKEQMVARLIQGKNKKKT